MTDCQTQIRPESLSEWSISDPVPLVLESQRICSKSVYLLLPLNHPEGSDKASVMDMIKVEKPYLKDIVNCISEFYNQPLKVKDIQRLKLIPSLEQHIQDLLSRFEQQQSSLRMYHLLPARYRKFGGLSSYSDVIESDEYQVYFLTQ